MSGVTLKGHGLTLVSESGLYKLIMRSDKPQARVFQVWVPCEVLPTIRTTRNPVNSTGYALPRVDRGSVGEGTVAETPALCLL